MTCRTCLPRHKQLPISRKGAGQHRCRLPRQCVQEMQLTACKSIPHISFPDLNRHPIKSLQMQSIYLRSAPFPHKGFWTNKIHLNSLLIKLPHLIIISKTLCCITPPCSSIDIRLLSMVTEASNTNNSKLMSTISTHLLFIICPQSDVLQNHQLLRRLKLNVWVALREAEVQQILASCWQKEQKFLHSC